MSCYTNYECVTSKCWRFCYQPVWSGQDFLGFLATVNLVTGHWHWFLILHSLKKQSRKDAGIVQTTEPNAQDTFDARFLRTSKYNVASILLSKQKSWIDNWVTGSQSYDYSDFCYLFSAAVSRFVLIWFVCAEQWVWFRAGSIFLPGASSRKSNDPRVLLHDDQCLDVGRDGLMGVCLLFLLHLVADISSTQQSFADSQYWYMGTVTDIDFV